MKKLNYFKPLAYIFFITLLASSLSSFGQVSSNPHQGGLNQLHYGDLIELQKGYGSRNFRITDVKGSPYLNDQFFNGHIILHDTVQYLDVPLRYNIFNEQIEYRISDTSYLAIYNPEAITEVLINGRKFIYADKRKKRYKNKGFYEVLFDGDLKLLAKHHIDFKYGQKALGYQSAKPPRFMRRINTFYSKTGDKKPIKISNKNQLKTVFSKILNNISDTMSDESTKENLVEITKLFEGQLRHRQTKIFEQQVLQYFEKSKKSDKIIESIEKNKSLNN